MRRTWIIAVAAAAVALAGCNREMTAPTPGSVLFRASIECVNNGDSQYAVAGNTSQGYAAGILGQFNADGSTIDACGNYGTVQSDMYFGSNLYVGLIVANANSKAVTVSNCKVGGALGPYVPTETQPVVAATADNFEQLITMSTAKATKVTFTGNGFATK
jgi:hypothetical protein